MKSVPEVPTAERVFAFVRDRIMAGEPPTVREVQAEFGFRSSGTAREHLDRLIAGGRLAKLPGLARGFRLPGAAGAGRRVCQVPVVGRVQAGRPAEALEDIDGYLTVESRHPPDDLFALRVRGDSMSGAGILDGDLVVVRRQPDAHSGQVVVALVDGEATVKRLRRPGGRIELHPENPTFPVIVPPPGRVAILGRVIEVRRWLE